MVDKQFHYKNEEPFEYLRDGKRALSSLATRITELYPTGWEDEHGADAESNFKKLHVGITYKHL